MLCENCLRPICNKYHNQNNHFLKKTFKTNFIILHLPVHHNHQQNCRSPFHLARIYYFILLSKSPYITKYFFSPSFFYALPLCSLKLLFTFSHILNSGFYLRYHLLSTSLKGSLHFLRSQDYTSNLVQDGDSY